MPCNGDYCEIEDTPIRRDLDGVYFRIQRDGRWQSVCFTDMTQAEQDRVTTDKPFEWWKRLALHLGVRLREVGDELDLVME